LTVLLSLEKWKIFITKKITASHIIIDISLISMMFSFNDWIGSGVIRQLVYSLVTIATWNMEPLEKFFLKFYIDMGQCIITSQTFYTNIPQFPIWDKHKVCQRKALVNVDHFLTCLFSISNFK
jgi:hypothetical protein